MKNIIKIQELITSGMLRNKNIDDFFEITTVPQNHDDFEALKQLCQSLVTLNPSFAFTLKNNSFKEYSTFYATFTRVKSL